MDSTLLMVPAFGVLIFVASLFSKNKGVSITLASILIPVCAVTGLIMSPSSESLFLILIVTCLIVYGSGRYWRNIEGFVKSRA